VRGKNGVAEKKMLGLKNGFALKVFLTRLNFYGANTEISLAMEDRFLQEFCGIIPAFWKPVP